MVGKHILEELGSFDEALACFERAVEVKPGYVEARNNLGHALRAVGRFDDAAQQLEQVLRAAPDSPLAQRAGGAGMSKP